MKKTLEIIAFTLLFAGTLFAQPLVKWGTYVPSPSNYKAKIQQLLFTGEDGFYALRKTTTVGAQSQYWLEKYDSDYSFVWVKDIPDGEGVITDYTMFREILSLKDKFLVFYSGLKRTDKESFFQVKIMSLNGELDKTAKKLESLTVDNPINSGSFKVTLSPDKSKLLLLTTFPQKKDEKYKIRARVFDTQTLKELWVKEVSLAFDSKKGGSDNILIDNAGNAYITERYVNETKKYAFDLYTYNAQTTEWKGVTLNTDGKIISDQTRFMFTPTGDVLFAGFLYTKSPYSYEGLFYVRINGNSQTIEASRTCGFGDTALKEKDDQQFYNWKLRSVVPQSNGNILIVAEDESYTQTSTGAGTFEYTYNYTTNNIKVACLQPDGNRAWVRTIPKHQTTTVPDEYRRWDSFVYGMRNDRLYIFYNNTGVSTMINTGWKEPDGTICKKKDFCFNTGWKTFLYIVEPNGELTYGDRLYGQPLYNFQQGAQFEMSLNSFLSYPQNNSVIVMSETMDGLRYQFGKINLP